jgi:hypothetical protein
MKVTDRKYLDFLQTEPCIICGLRTDENETVEPAHIGTYGKSMKSDDEALPLRHRYHNSGHQSGEISMWRQNMPDWLLRECLRAYARQLYAKWKNDQ